MTPEPLNRVLAHYGFDSVSTIEQIERGGEWRVRQGDRILRWAPADRPLAEHIVRDAQLLSVLEHHHIPAPELLALDMSDSAQVVSVQDLRLPGAHTGLGATGLSEQGWRSLGGYLFALHERGPLSPTSRSMPPVNAERALALLRDRQVLDAAQVRWVRRWLSLVPPAVPVLTHGMVTPSWVVTDDRGDLVLGLTDWSVAGPRLPGHDFLHLPEAARWTVLEGYGQTGFPRLLQVYLHQLLEAARDVAPEAVTGAALEQLHRLIEEELRL
ncbi:phosphotransferase [Deinococcus radiotolerans]|uniref:Aminoglycoside phosphotransferase domain-containing protein n=1 Tax=Deinococcus radiotolerans TaxID=1309407 RepID=A0ABQ2FFZ1_9DEIO|nr:phosphotransferase [Deinococcus radiotolerans]GGK85599.1 hypothetical protein GCM10010844_00120 [Deinococcus radiotolerans]